MRPNVSLPIEDSDVELLYEQVMNMSAKREHHRCGFANEILHSSNLLKQVLQG